MWHNTNLPCKGNAIFRGSTVCLTLVGLLFGGLTPARADNSLQVVAQLVSDYAQYLQHQVSNPHSLEHSISLYHYGAYDKALSELTPLLTAMPRNVAARNLRGLIYMAQGQYNKALLDFDVSLATTPNETDTRFNHGLALLHLTRYPEAIADFDRVVATNSDDYDAFHYRALCYYNQQNFTRAESDYAECVRIRPADPAAYRNRALALLHQEKFIDAIDCLNVYIGFNPNDAETYFNRGMAYLHLGKFDRAITDLTKFTMLHPENTNAWYQLALCFLNRADREWEKAEESRASTDYAQAVSHFHEVIRRHKENSYAFFNIGQACIKLAKVTEEEAPYKEAQSALETFLQLSPNDLDAPAVRQQLEQIRARLSSRQ